MLLRSAKTRSHDAEFGAIAKIIFAACAHSEQLLHRNFRATFGLSRPYRNFQKNFPESLVQAKFTLHTAPQSPDSIPDTLQQAATHNRRLATSRAFQNIF